MRSGVLRESWGSGRDGGRGSEAEPGGVGTSDSEHRV